MTTPTPNPKKPVRAAVYTRKSSEAGLDMEFNSLDAQRECGVAYVASQKAEGWVCLPDRYDDGGYTGGNMDRPALKRLVADIEAGKVDAVVVYKIDRLSRSLMDFSRLMEVFERKGVSFVSVTQSFNSSSSMGRLTLNMLLSFAQFERELVSERTRDKIAATRRRGLYTAKRAPLGYDFAPVAPPLTGKRLVPHPVEAERVREIFRLYLTERSLMKTAAECAARGWTAKSGATLDKKLLAVMLRNPLYVGRVPHAGKTYPGEHEAIVSQELYDRVQAQLKLASVNGGAAVRNTSGALLKGLLRCGSCGCAMSPTTATRKRRGGAEIKYGYYRCSNAAHRGADACPCPSLPAREVEGFVVEQIRAVLADDGTLRAVADRAMEILRESAARRAAELVRLRNYAGKLSPTAASHARELARVRRQVEALEAQVARDRERLVDEDELVGAVEAWDGVWGALTAAERAELVAEVVAGVVFNAHDESCTVQFKPWVGAGGKAEARSA